MFFVDKYNPKSIDDISFHQHIFKKLLTISKDDSVPHIIIYGPEGSGKKTIIRFFLEMLYDKQIYNLSDAVYTVTGSGSSSSDEVIKQSPYHIIVEPKNNNFDRYLIQDVVKEYARREPLNVYTVKKKFKTVLINNIGNLSYYAQTSLRRTMETYSKSCRFIMWTRSLSKVIKPLRSRCKCIRVDVPSDSDLFSRLFEIAMKERIGMTLNDYTVILDRAKGNVKTALWLLELRKHGHNYDTNYDEVIDVIDSHLIQAKMGRVLKIREELYSAMITNINGSKILKDITTRLVKNDNIPNSAKHKIIDSAATCEYRLRMGRREIIHLEHFIATIICILKNDENYDYVEPKARVKN